MLKKITILIIVCVLSKNIINATHVIIENETHFPVTAKYSGKHCPTTNISVKPNETTEIDIMSCCHDGNVEFKVPDSPAVNFTPEHQFPSCNWVAKISYSGDEKGIEVSK